MTLLYHGTNGAWLDRILAVGLLPRGRRGGNWKTTVESNSKCVYLTDSYAPYFAFNASRGKDPSCTVIEVDTDRLDHQDLFPDEDFLEQTSRDVSDPVAGGMVQRTRHYRRLQTTYNWPCQLPESMGGGWTTWWEASLRFLGTCSHLGHIPASAITRAVWWPRKGNEGLSFVWDPLISLMNQRVVGDRYRAMTAKLFAGDFTTIEEAQRRAATSDEARLALHNDPMLPVIDGWRLVEK